MMEENDVVDGRILITGGLEMVKRERISERRLQD
jgi:hypothetical protein